MDAVGNSRSNSPSAAGVSRSLVAESNATVAQQAALIAFRANTHNELAAGSSSSLPSSSTAAAVAAAAAASESSCMLPAPSAMTPSTPFVARRRQPASAPASMATPAAARSPAASTSHIQRDDGSSSSSSSAGPRSLFRTPKKNNNKLRCPKHFHKGPHEAASPYAIKPTPAGKRAQPDPVKEEQTPVPSKPVLYKHALECVSAFLPLAQLSLVCAVSKTWPAAVMSMAIIHATHGAGLGPFPRPHAEWKPTSVARHISTLGSASEQTELSQEGFRFIHQHMTGLHTLHCWLNMPIEKPVFPASPTELFACFHPDQIKDQRVTADDVNSLISTIGESLLQLRSLQLQLPEDLLSVSFLPLRNLSQLRELRLYSREAWIWGPEHIEQLRGLTQLASINGPLCRVD